MLLKQEQNLQLKKWQDFQTIFAGIHLLFKIVINLKISENLQEYI